MPTSKRFAELNLLLDALGTCAHPVEIDDTEGFVLFANQAWCELFGQEPQDLVGARWDALQPAGADLDGLNTSWDRCLARGTAEGQLIRHSVDNASLLVSYSRLLLWDR